MLLIVNIVLTLLEVYSWALIVYILMSWFPNARESSIGQFLGTICEPYLEVFRRVIPPIGMFDLSAIVGIIVLNLARNGVIALYTWF